MARPEALPASGFPSGSNEIGTRTWLDTGAGALDHLHEIAHLRPGPPQQLPSGFVRIPLTL